MLERKRKKEGCTFCELTEKCLREKIEIKDPRTGEKQSLDCNRGFYDQSDHCIVTLAPEQYSIGHTLVILWNHSDDLSDGSVEDTEYLDLCKTIKNVSNILKNKLYPKPERIYVNSLCDGVEHLHFHRKLHWIPASLLAGGKWLAVRRGKDACLSRAFPCINMAWE